MQWRHWLQISPPKQVSAHARGINFMYKTHAHHYHMIRTKVELSEPVEFVAASEIVGYATTNLPPVRNA